MNTITFNPNITTNNISKINSTPNFTGAKNIKPNDAKKTINLAQKIYQKLFVPKGERFVKMENGTVITVKTNKSNTLKVASKYNLFSRTPKEQIKTNSVTQIRVHTKRNKDNSLNIEYSDIYNPEFKISAKYGEVKKDKSEKLSKGNTLKLSYCDQEIELSPEQRILMAKEFEESLSSRIEDPLDVIKKSTPEEIKAYCDAYYTSPEHIASTILTGPERLKEQLKKVPRSLPYGIEAIMDKVAKS